MLSDPTVYGLESLAIAAQVHALVYYHYDLRYSWWDLDGCLNNLATEHPILWDPFVRRRIEEAVRQLYLRRAYREGTVKIQDSTK